MQTIGGLDNILADHFKPYRVERNANRFEVPHALIVAAVPVVAGALIAYFSPHFITANAGPIVAIYAVMASVMTATMPTINGLIGPVDRERIAFLKTASTTSDDNIREARVLAAKVEIVRGLYAAVAWSVIVLCVALIPLLVIGHSAFQLDMKSPPIDMGWPLRSIRMALAVVIAFAGCTSFVALLQIVSGVHLMLRHGQADVETEIKGLSDRYQL